MSSEYLSFKQSMSPCQFSGDFGCSHMPLKVVLLTNPSVLLKIKSGMSVTNCRSGGLAVLTVPAARGLWSMLFQRSQELPCRCTEVLLVVCYLFLSSPELSESFCWFAAVPRSTGLQVQLTPASLQIPVQGRLKWVCVGIEARSGGFELVFAGCLKFCGNALLKLQC